jgi:hypothetical protein
MGETCGSIDARDGRCRRGVRDWEKTFSSSFVTSLWSSTYAKDSERYIDWSAYRVPTARREVTELPPSLPQSSLLPWTPSR